MSADAPVKVPVKCGHKQFPELGCILSSAILAEREPKWVYHNLIPES